MVLVFHLLHLLVVAYGAVFKTWPNKNTQLENMCDRVFEKTKGRGGTVNRTSVYAEAAIRGFFKKSIMRNFAVFTRNHLCGILFFATSLKASLQRSCFLVNFAKFVKWGLHWVYRKTGTQDPSGILPGPYKNRKTGTPAGPYENRKTGTLAGPYKSRKTGTLAGPCENWKIGTLKKTANHDSSRPWWTLHKSTCC